jgi:hypothetical protein
MTTEFETSVDDEGATAIIWQVRTPWQLREAIFDGRFVADDRVIGLAIDNVAIDNLIFPTYIESWDREEPLSEENYKSLPTSHRDQLAHQVGLYVALGYNLTADMRERRKAEADAVPLRGGSTETS